jgi:hypothetical protein
VHNMGSEDNKMFEDALKDLREQNDRLVHENKDLKMFLTAISNEITKFLTKGNKL